MVMFSVAAKLELPARRLNAKFRPIDVPMICVLQYVTVLNRVLDDIAYFAAVFMVGGVVVVVVAIFFYYPAKTNT